MARYNKNGGPRKLSKNQEATKPQQCKEEREDTPSSSPTAQNTSAEGDEAFQGPMEVIHWIPTSSSSNESDVIRMPMKAHHQQYTVELQDNIFVDENQHTYCEKVLENVNTFDYECISIFLYTRLKI